MSDFFISDNSILFFNPRIVSKRSVGNEEKKEVQFRKVVKDKNSAKYKAEKRKTLFLGDSKNFDENLTKTTSSDSEAECGTEIFGTF